MPTMNFTIDEYRVLARVGAEAARQLAIIDGATGQPPIQQPDPPQPLSDGIAGAPLLMILASLNWAFGDATASQTGQVGSPVDDGIAALGGDVVAWNRYVNATADANVLVPAAKWLRAGLTLDQMNQALSGENRSITADQLNSLAAVMRHYNLLQ